MSTNDTSFSWGAETFERPQGRRRHTRDSTRELSLLRLRMRAIVIDGLLLVVPVFAIAFLMSLAFPHNGFFFVDSGGLGTTSYTLPLPGVLLITSLSLSYFFFCEARFGQTVGKRKVGLRVEAASGGAAGLNGTSARTVLRLIDGIAFYLVGLTVALLSGSRRRRIGDWAGGTVVVREDGHQDRSPQQPALRVAVYPAIWLTAVLVAVFALGLGTAVGEGEQAVALVSSYVSARAQGNAALACSMLTVGEQREVVAIQGENYPEASASLCPRYILQSDPSSHLLNPGLAELAASPMRTAYFPLGAVVVSSPQDPGMQLVAVQEDGRLKLDVRGLEKIGFVSACSSSGRLTSAECSCTFDSARAEGMLPDHGFTPGVRRAMQADEVRCRGGSGAAP